jgi:hypothetical protein
MRSKDQGIAEAIAEWKIRRLDRAQKADARVSGGEGFETRPLLTIAGNDERGWLRRLEPLDRPDQQLDILSLDQPTDGDEDDAVRQSKPGSFAFGRGQSP